MTERRVCVWTIHELFLKKHKREKSEAKNHQTSTIYTVQITSDISRSEDNDLKYRISTNQRQEITRDNNDEVPVDSAPAVIPVHAVSSKTPQDVFLRNWEVFGHIVDMENYIAFHKHTDKLKFQHLCL